MPGISALLCTAAEVSARQRLLDSAGAIYSMADNGGCAPSVAAPPSDADGGLQYAEEGIAPLEPLDQCAGPQGEEFTLEAAPGTGKDAHLQVRNCEV